MGKHECEYGRTEFSGNGSVDILLGFCEITNSICSCKPSEYGGFNRGYLGLTKNDVAECSIKHL